MRNWLIYNGKSTKDFGVYISGLNTYDSPERDVSEISVAGRSGDLTLDNGRYKNVTLTYPAFIYDRFDSNIEGFRNFLLSQTGYKRLEDTYHPDEYRLALVKGNIKPTVEANLVAGKFDISFNCKPQRYLKIGEIPVDLDSNAPINNPTLFPALPILKVYGKGTFHIGDYSATIAEHTSDYMIIDCEMMDAYYETQNLNGYLTVGSNGFPKIEPGQHNITMDETITRMIVIPRWYII